MSLSQHIVYWSGITLTGLCIWSGLHLMFEVQCQGRSKPHVYTWADGCVRVQP
jgi:hypothetical protein